MIVDAEAVAAAIVRAPPEAVGKALRELSLAFLGLGDEVNESVLAPRYAEAADIIKATLDAALGPE